MEENKKKACPDVQSISAYLDGELTSDGAAFICSHLDECEDCRRYADEMSRLSDIISEGDVEIPSELHDRIMWGVRAEAIKDRRKAIVRKIGLYCGAGVAAMLCISLVTSPIFKGTMSKGGDAECEDNVDCAPIEAKSANGYISFSKDDSYLYFEDASDEEAVILPEEVAESIAQTETVETEETEEIEETETVESPSTEG